MRVSHSKAYPPAPANGTSNIMYSSSQRLQLGTCKSEIFVRIESRIESANYDSNSNLELNHGAVGYVIIIITDERVNMV